MKYFLLLLLMTVAVHAFEKDDIVYCDIPVPIELKVRCHILGWHYVKSARILKVYVYKYKKVIDINENHCSYKELDE